MINIKNVAVGVLAGSMLVAGVSLSYLTVSKHTPTEEATTQAKQLPVRIDLGMNGVPVLNQGQHGSCVTFAITAALDAVSGKGDYISQLCLLQLGNYFQDNAYAYSGWEGSYGRLIMTRIETFGVVSKASQQKYGCGGYKQYNSYDADKRGSTSLAEYKKLSQNLVKEDPNKVGDIYWYILSDSYENRKKGVDGEKLLVDVKKSLASGDRVALGAILVDLSVGQNGAYGEYKAPDDTWVLGLNSLPAYLTGDVGGHEMVVIGYDDNASVTTQDGVKHKGLIKLRNSWGKNAGDNGDFYMSYGYFKMFAQDALVISKIK